MKMYTKNKITVYTPTYNRGYCLSQLYESLNRQTNKNFLWLIIDDGSTDNTEVLVKKWSKEADFEIVYVKQKNEGKMNKLNYAHSVITTELCMCIDSDDYLTDDAIEIIFEEWQKVRDNPTIAGLVGLDIFKDGSIVGTEFPNSIKKIKYRDFEKYKIKGDKKFVYNTKIINSYPDYPSFENEKFPAPGYLYRLIDVDYDLWIIHRPLCVVEYMEDGLSRNKFSQFKYAPHSFMFYRHERMRLSTSFLEKYRNAVHYVSSCIFAKKGFFKDNKYSITTFLALPLGLLLNLYINKTNKKGVV